MRRVTQWRRWVPIAMLAVVVAAGSAGCADAPVAPSSGGSAAPSSGGPGVPTTTAPAPAAVAALDTGYARMMLGHHEQALELSALVAGRSSSPDVADLAFRIDRAQVEEVGQLEGFLRVRGAPTGPPPGMAGMDGMADAATLARLRTLRGPAFDRLWLRTMTAHHEGALTMARDQLAATGGVASTSALAEFSRTLLVAQQAEIDRMRVLLGP
ncbi:DUF305 domain-containing protein [Actinomycetospora endophytica]|uniref:DUF305 domain-containing protein n=1 Tax=Actinomycetospora endophytica TaxID=2291215 RepID=A0ABS8PG71_9PSEU|nr:DUF305 domain-containing protein [Actinomycetospora endophytica]MCD2195999.1 DUF305 domain-containing protein [Actinomycetospora endophytica]